jgi:hypothetical protein
MTEFRHAVIAAVAQLHRKMQDGFGALTPQPTLGFIHNFNEHITFFVFCAFHGRPNVLHICYNRSVRVRGDPVMHAMNRLETF